MVCAVFGFYTLSWCWCRCDSMKNFCFDLRNMRIIQWWSMECGEKNFDWLEEGGFGWGRLMCFRLLVVVESNSELTEWVIEVWFAPLVTVTEWQEWRWTVYWFRRVIDMSEAEKNWEQWSYLKNSVVNLCLLGQRNLCKTFVALMHRVQVSCQSWRTSQCLDIKNSKRRKEHR